MIMRSHTNQELRPLVQDEVSQQYMYIERLECVLGSLQRQQCSRQVRADLQLLQLSKPLPREGQRAAALKARSAIAARCQQGFQVSFCLLLNTTNHFAEQSSLPGAESRLLACYDLNHMCIQTYALLLLCSSWPHSILFFFWLTCSCLLTVSRGLMQQGSKHPPALAPSQLQWALQLPLCTAWPHYLIC